MKKYLKISLTFIVWLIPIGMLFFVILLKADYLKSVNKNQPFELINDMDNGINLRPQSKNLFFEHKGTESLRPKNSVPISGKLYGIEQNNIDSSAINGDNPLPDSKIIQQYGKYLYETHCIYCHNFNADGNGPILTKVELKEDEEPFPTPPDIRNKGKDILPDSRIFHILSAGQNLMFPVNYKLTDNDKWSVIKYLRILQNKK